MYRLIIVLLLLAAIDVEARDRCSQRWACVEVERDEDGTVNFYLRNKKAYNITMTLDVKPRGLKLIRGDDGNSATRTIKGFSRQLALSYKPASSYRRPSYSYDYNWAVGSLDVSHDDDYLYRPPHSGAKVPYVVQGFNGGYSHRGLAKYSVDFAMPDGSSVYAAREGVVVDIESRHNKGGASRRYARYANFIVVEHSDGSTGEYYHLQQHGVFVKVGDKVKRGQLIGLSGSTGFTSLPHLHFAVYKALPDGDTQSLPIKFLTRNGVVERPTYGHRLMLAEED